MKLVSINVEGMRFAQGGLSLCAELSPEIVCFMEAPEATAATLTERGYHVTFAPMTIHTYEGTTYTEGVLLATIDPHTATTHYYHPLPAISPYMHERRRETMAHTVIFASTKEYSIATTHFTWNPRGEVADEHQIGDMKKLLAFLDTQPPHILCGDLNIPRFQNHLYDELTKLYTDNIPHEYASSLDKERHHLGSNPEKQFLFDSFMVDYLFTQPPYQASEVRLQFGVSDHAAILANIEVAEVT